MFCYLALVYVGITVLMYNGMRMAIPRAFTNRSINRGVGTGVPVAGAPIFCIGSAEAGAPLFCIGF